VVLTVAVLVVVVRVIAHPAAGGPVLHRRDPIAGVVDVMNGAAGPDDPGGPPTYTRWATSTLNPLTLFSFSNW
jgi:hypothetical protein